MLLAVCQAQTDKIYAHLDAYGVSVSLVYRLERMRAQISRMGRLIDVRSAVWDGHGASRVSLLLSDLISAHHSKASIRELIRRSFSLLARKMVERHADHGEYYIARDGIAYRAMLKAAVYGGCITALTVVIKYALGALGLAHFFEGVFAAINYSLSFLLIAAVGGVLATKQPAVTAPALAAKMGELDNAEGLRDLLSEVAMLLRSQAAAVFGNVVSVVPVTLLVVWGVKAFTGSALMDPAHAHAVLQQFSIIGPTPLYAACTGILLWLSSLAAGIADNWFALRRLREALAHQRRMVHVLGANRAERCAAWLERNVSLIVGSISLGVLLGMTPVLAQFFGIPFEVRHVTLAAGTLAAAVAGLNTEVLMNSSFWLAVSGVAIIGILNVGVAFSCAMALALRARDIPARVRRLVFRAVIRRFAVAPTFFFFPERKKKEKKSKGSATS